MEKDKITPINARDEADIFNDLQILCGSTGYIHAIAYFCWRDNLIPFSGSNITEDDLQHQYSQDQLLRTEISTLIGLMAKGDVNPNMPSPQTLQNYIDRSEALLHEMHMSLQKPWMAAFREMARSSPKTKLIDPFSTAEGLREPIFYGGESAYNFQYEELARRKYQNDDDWLRLNKGFTIDQACTVANALGKLQLEKIKRLHKTMRSLHPDQWSFLPSFSFTLEELVTPTGLSLEIITLVISAFCFTEDSKNASFSGLSEFNEANSTPIITLDENSYFLFQHYSLLEALYETPFFWMIGDKNYRSKASKNRGLFTEKFLTERLERVFGPPHVFANVDIYKGKDRFAEADVLVFYGDRAIVVQAKSKRLTIEARKGNDLQLKDDFKKAIHDAYNQSQLCCTALLGEGYKFVLSSGEEIKAPGKLTKIFPLCVVSDHYPALAAQARQFLEIKKTETIQSPIITDVFFIDVLTEILNSPLHIFNYFALRAQFGEKLLVSQELTTLGYHLKHNLWLEEKYDMVNLGDDFTSSLDIAMSARRLGVPGLRTPNGILTRFNGSPIGELLSEIEARATPELVGLGMLFLQLGADTASHINTGLKKMVQAAAADGQHHDFSVPAEHGKSGFTIHVSSLPETTARERLFSHCGLRKYDTKSDTWYGLRLSPGSGKILDALAIEGKWKADSNMEKALAAWPRKPLMPISAFSGIKKRKLGRNDPCSCGSGKKYKNCCLHS